MYPVEQTLQEFGGQEQEQEEGDHWLEEGESRRFGRGEAGAKCFWAGD